MIIALIVIVVLAVIVAGMYNSLVQARNKEHGETQKQLEKKLT